MNLVYFTENSFRFLHEDNKHVIPGICGWHVGIGQQAPAYSLPKQQLKFKQNSEFFRTRLLVSDGCERVGRLITNGCIVCISYQNIRVVTDLLVLNFCFLKGKSHSKCLNLH